MNHLEIDDKIITSPLWDIVLDIKSQLTNGKLHIVKKQGNKNIRVTCPNRNHSHGKEANPDCDIYIGPTLKDNNGEVIVQYGTVKCFACDFKTDFVGFVAECFEISYEEAKEWLLDNYCDGFVEYQLDVAEPINLNNNNLNIEEIIDKDELNCLEDYHPYMEKRKITPEVAKEFGVKYSPIHNTIVFPVKDEYGNLVMYTQRSVVDKTFIIDANKRKPIYLLYYLIQRNIKEAFVCESQINALTLWGHGLPGIALFGTGSDYQYEILNNSEINHYYLLFDGDNAGDKGIKNFLSNIRKDVMVDVIKLPRGKDVNDLSYEELEQLIAQPCGDILL